MKVRVTVPLPGSAGCELEIRSSTPYTIYRQVYAGLPEGLQPNLDRNTLMIETVDGHQVGCALPEFLRKAEQRL